MQVDADIKVLSEFLSYLQTDSVRATVSISSLSPIQSASRNSRKFSDSFRVPYPQLGIDYTSRLTNLKLPLRLLVENEIFRLAVWANPSNETKRGTDHVGTTERTLLEVGCNNI